MLWTRPGCGLFLFSSPKVKTGSVFPPFCHATFHHALITCCNVFRANFPSGEVHFDFTQGHVTKNQLMAAPVFLSESLRIDGFHCDVIKL